MSHNHFPTPKQLMQAEEEKEENLYLRELLDRVELTRPGDEVSSSDYEAIKKRASVLAREARGGASASKEELFIVAFIDRMEFLKKFNLAEVRNLPSEVPKAYMQVNFGLKMTEEEMRGFHKSELSIDEWAKQRREAQSRLPSDSYVVEDVEGRVVAQGGSLREAMLNAQNENGQKENRP
jgi:hypothetical protein